MDGRLLSPLQQMLCLKRPMGPVVRPANWAQGGLMELDDDLMAMAHGRYMELV